MVHWLFSPGVKSYWERAYPWEAVRLALDALIEEMLETFKQLRTLNRDRLKLERERMAPPTASPAGNGVQVEGLSGGKQAEFHDKADHTTPRPPARGWLNSAWLEAVD